MTAGTTTIYLVFLVYFDWLRDSFYLPRIRQQLWTSLHLPFHLALVLFMQGFTQYLLWSKITGQAERALDIADPFDDAKEMTSLKVRDSMNASVQAFFQDYPPKILSTVETVNQALNNLTTISNSFWPLLVNGTVPSDLSSAPPGYEADLATTNDAFVTLIIAMYNALFAAFGINLEEDVSHKYPTAAKEVKDGGYQVLIYSKTWQRYNLVVCKPCPPPFTMLHSCKDPRLTSLLRTIVCIRLHRRGMYDCSHGSSYHHRAHHPVQTVADCAPCHHSPPGSGHRPSRHFVVRQG